jgi:hypothetical protein
LSSGNYSRAVHNCPFRTGTPFYYGLPEFSSTTLASRHTLSRPKLPYCLLHLSVSYTAGQSIAGRSFGFLLFASNMDCKYQALSPVPEKRRGESFDSSSTLGDLDDLEVPIQSQYCGVLGRHPTAFHSLVTSRWLWLIHGILLMVSCTILALAINLRSSTLQHVRQFSAWCKCCTAHTVWRPG